MRRAHHDDWRRGNKVISHLQMISIFVTDLERSLAFYTEKLGFVKTAVLLHT